MNPSASTDYSVLDHPDICARIFHPRTEPPRQDASNAVMNHMIPVDGDLHVGAKFHLGEKSSVNVLLFHGNGEIAADYGDVGAHLNRLGINFMVVDYRGYGRSDGEPTVTGMMNDCHAIFNHVHKWLGDNGYTGPLAVMGRSLGSASALELAFAYPSRIDALIIESGFAFTEPLLRLLGVDIQSIDFHESASFGNLFKAGTYHGPTLFIHAEYDHLIPATEGQALYDVSPSTEKEILIISDADHNDILVRGWNDYFGAIHRLANALSDRVQPFGVDGSSRR